MAPRSKRSPGAYGGAALLLTLLVCMGVAAAETAATAAQRPRLRNAEVSEMAAAGDLQETLRRVASTAEGPVWVGYAVEMIEADEGRHKTMCCGGSHRGRCCDLCELEDDDGFSISHDGEDGAAAVRGDTLHLEGAGPVEMFVLLRLQAGRVVGARSVTADCRLDGGGLPFVWLTGVRETDSVGLMAGLAGAETSGERAAGVAELAERAVAVLAQHAHAEADRRLAELAAPRRPAELREKVAFWLGAARGEAGLGTLERMARTDPDPEVREKVAFALSVSDVPAAVDELVRMAGEDRSSEVRGQALFWLAQKAGERAAAAIAGAVDDDPEVEVKLKAVFALAQLPTDDGVPLLIEVAGAHPHPRVRKQAIFWLGQSQDPRALDFFARVLRP